MVLDAAAVEQVLTGTDLIGLPVTEGPGGVVVVEDIAVRDVLTQWRAARSVVEQTGRWPVAFTLEFAGSLDDAIGAPTAEQLDVLQLMAESGDPWTDDWEPWPVEGSELEYRAKTPSGLDLVALAERSLSLPTTEPILDRWLYDQVLAVPGQRERELAHVAGYASTEYWFVPDSASLALLPTSSPWLAPAWLSYFGALGEHAWTVTAALHQWHRRWGAELVASWGTMLQVVPARRPADGEEAWQLAGELKKIGGSLQMDQWQLALAVAEGDAWFLHDRP